MRRLGSLLVVLALLVAAAVAPTARADGDPGSDVLVYQPTFFTSAAQIPVAQQVRLDALVRQAGHAGFPIRIAIIASPSDLGAVTGLWKRPRAYARFLGIELSLSYRGRLLVVMPNGLGFNWPGHSVGAAYRALNGVRIAPGGAGLAEAAALAVRSLAGTEHIRLPTSVARQSSGSPGAAPAPAAPASHTQLLTILFILVAAVAVALILALTRRNAVRYAQAGRRAVKRLWVSRRLRRPSLYAIPLLALAIGLTAAALSLGTHAGATQSGALASNPALDPGTGLSGPAPDFTLTDQFGQPISLRSFRGKVVILAFNDSQCSTVCPLTTTAMVQAKRMLGAHGAEVQLLGVDANPKATTIEDVLAYSEVHGMTRDWHFLTGSLPQLKRVWKAYSTGVEIDQGLIDHTPAIFIIDTHGRLAKLYLTQQSYAAVDQLGQVLAQETASLLPGHPPVNSALSYAPRSGIGPGQTATLPRAGGGQVRLGPDGRPRLFLFFATWDRELSSLAGELRALDRYQQLAATIPELAPLTAIDEGSVEPSPAALPGFLHGLGAPLAYPVAIDRSGRVADGYGVQGQPWLALTSANGRILWYWPVANSGWLSRRALVHHVLAALARGPRTPTSGAAQQQLIGSPPQLAALHQQAARLLGSQPALAARIQALRGYPIVVNAWASWCTPCRAEFGLLAAASARYGRQVAFLGADSDDSAADAQAFLAQHPVSYPSYQTTTSGLRSLLSQGLAGLPTTIYISRAGAVTYVHTGQYESQGALDADIESYTRAG